MLFAVLCAFLVNTAFAQEQEPEARATFLVLKIYDDANPAPVDVTISCNTGLPLEQTFSLDPFQGDPNDSVEFVVTDFNSGELDCEISEVVPVGYQVIYVWVDEGSVFQTEEPCLFEDVEHGDTGELIAFGDEVNDNVCIPVNLLLPSEVAVTKEWIDENPQFQPSNFAKADYVCTNVPFNNDRAANRLASLNIGAPSLDAPEGGNDPHSGTLTFVGNPDTQTFETFANWDGGTECDVTERTVEGGVETDSSDCQNILLFPGDNAECTIVNTRLFEGIPTMSRHGLALLTLLMLGMGLVAYRRFV